MINLKNIFQQPVKRGIAWLMYFSPVRYGFTGMMVAQFPVGDKNAPKDSDSYKSYEATSQILDDYGFTGHSYWNCIAALFALFIVFRGLVIVSLACQDKRRGGSSNDTRNTDIPAPRRPAQVAQQ